MRLIAHSGSLSYPCVLNISISLKQTLDLALMFSTIICIFTYTNRDPTFASVNKRSFTATSCYHYHTTMTHLRHQSPSRPPSQSKDD